MAETPLLVAVVTELESDAVPDNAIPSVFDAETGVVRPLPGPQDLARNRKPSACIGSLKHVAGLPLYPAPFAAVSF